MHPRTKLIIEEIGIPTGRSPKANLLFRLCAARADRCLGVSNAVGDYLRQMRIPARKRQVLFNGVRDLPATEDRASVRRSLGFANDAVVVGSVGRMYDHVKRFSDLIRAFALVAPTQPKARLLLVGEGPDRAMLTRLAATLGVSERVVFTGYRRDTANLYGAMDVFALTSARESFGLVLVEAMFAALPTICTATGGMVDVVVDKETGLHVPCGAVEQLAAAMTRLLADAGLRERLGEAGALRAASRFSAARYAADVAAVYEDVLRA
jgi:glycosyltransferase involved in cell wall biosynthesis